MNGFIEVDENAPNVLKVLHDRARKKMEEEGKLLLEWSRSLEEHSLSYEAWKDQRNS